MYTLQSKILISFLGIIIIGTSFYFVFRKNNFFFENKENSQNVGLSNIETEALSTKNVVENSVINEKNNNLKANTNFANFTNNRKEYSFFYPADWKIIADSEALFKKYEQDKTLNLLSNELNKSSSRVIIGSPTNENTKITFTYENFSGNEEDFMRIIREGGNVSQKTESGWVESKTSSILLKGDSVLISEFGSKNNNDYAYSYYFLYEGKKYTIDLFTNDIVEYNNSLTVLKGLIGSLKIF